MLIGLSGKAGAGKDETAKVLVERYNFRRLALATKMKEFALAVDPYVGVRHSEPYRLSELIAAVGPEEAKKWPEVRRLYQRIGTEGGRETLYEDLWVQILFNHMVGQRHKDWVISDVRFLNEVRAIQKKGGFVIRIIRPEAGLDGETADHISENQLTDDGLYDGFLYNDLTLDELPAKVVKALAELGRINA